MLNKRNSLKKLILYYGVLQSLHLLILLRAGLLLLSGQASPFPILPPPHGWQEQTWPFMFGLAGMDVVAIFLAFIFVYQAYRKNKIMDLIGILSLTIFISGAIIFAVGTLFAGAWRSHPIEYGLMAILFLPALVLYGLLIRRLSHTQQYQQDAQEKHGP